MSLQIIKSGSFTTVQDLGRSGYQRYGVVVSGGMDDYALRAANLILGNDENDAVLEMTMQGPIIRFEHNTRISICGADFSATINGRNVPMWRPICVKAGSVLEFGYAADGCRTYLAVSGGIQLPPVLESRSTYVRGGMGGLSGRALQKEDTLPITKQLDLRNASFGTKPFGIEQWYLSQSILPVYSNHPVLRFIEGPEYKLFEDKSIEALMQEQFTIDPQSDRMGYQLKGHALRLKHPYEMLSEAVTVGTMQIPPSGDPILLLKDRQTTGGYPRIAQVITVDIPLLAQLKPHDTVRFQEVTHEEAEKLFIERERQFRLIKQVVLLKKGEGNVGSH